MPRLFATTTAEQVIATVEAVVVNNKRTTVAFAADFSDNLPNVAQATAALEMAQDLGLVQRDGPGWINRSPLSRFLSTSAQPQKAAVMRIVLESYEPFIVFRQQLVATGDATKAARQTRTVLDLDAHHEQIKDTLVGLGTYAQALKTSGGGQYAPGDQPIANVLAELARACADVAAAEARIREHLGQDAANAVSKTDVIDPLANALIRAAKPDPRAAVTEAANAVESFLTAAAPNANVGLAGANGINAKVQRFVTAHVLPAKIASVGHYLGHLRNAADHGADQEVGAPWTIRDATGLEYVFVASSFIAAATRRLAGRSPEV
jgi:hypothetical protein